MHEVEVLNSRAVVQGMTSRKYEAGFIEARPGCNLPEKEKRDQSICFLAGYEAGEVVPQHAPLRVAVKRLIGRSSREMLAMPGPILYRESCHLVCRILFTAMPDRAASNRETDFQILVRTGLIEMGAV